MIPLGIIASAHQFVGGQRFTFNTHTYAESVTNPSDATDTLTISLTAGNEGDLAILWVQSTNFASTSMPIQYYPYGWVPIESEGFDTGNEFRVNFCWRILTAADASSGSVTTGEAEVHTAYVLFFTPTEALSALDHFDWEYQQTAGNPALQTQNITTSGGSAPAIAIGAKLAYANNSTAQQVTFTTDPFDATFNNSLGEIIGGATSTYEQATRIGYAIQNSTLSDLSFDSGDDVAAQQQMSFHMTPADKALSSSGLWFGYTGGQISFTQGRSNELMLLYVARANIGSTAMPNALAPSGWTEVIDVQHNAGQEFRLQVFAKIRQPDEASVSLTDGSEEGTFATIRFFTANFPMSSITVGSTAFENTLGDQSPQAQNVTTSGVTVPVVVGGMKVTYLGLAAFSSPDWDGATENNDVVSSGDIQAGFGFSIQNGTGSDVTVDSVDQGAMQTLLSFHLEVD